MRSLLFAAGLVAGVAASGTGSASLLELREVTDLAAVSDACVRGRILEQRVAWSDDGRVIVTTYTLDPLEILAGEAPVGPITIQRVGGTLEGLTLAYDGMPELGVGEHVIVFLRAHGAGRHLLVGLKQGVLREDGGSFTRDLSGVSGAAGPTETWPLPDLRTAVRAVRAPTP